MSVLLFKNILFTILVPGFTAVLLPRWVAGRPSVPPLESWGPRHRAGAVVAAVGFAVYLRCVWDFGRRGRGTPLPLDPPRVLVANGLYRWVRNPMYWGVGLFVFGQAVFFASRDLLVYLAAAFAVVHLFVVLYEENALRAAFGKAYEDYCRNVPRWLPRRPKT